MEFVGLIALGLVLMLMPMQSETKELKRRVRKLEKKGEKRNMSKIIESIIGKKCEITVDGECFFGETQTIVEVDDDWVKVISEDKKGNTRTEILRVDDITKIELCD